MNERKSKNIVIIALCITLIFMGVGFSALTANLEINGTATVSGSWNVQITDIKATSAHIAGQDTTDVAAYNAVLAEGDTTSNGVRYTATAATFNLTLNEPGDWVEYEVTVTNGGNIDATLESVVTSLDTVTEDAEKLEPIKYTLTPAEGDLLSTGETTDTYIVRATYDPSFVGANAPAAEKMSRAYTVTMNYVQK